jgi:hypothetical protein
MLSIRLLRPRFTLWAMLVFVTVVAIPLSYVAQRRAWNLRRLRTIEELGRGKKFALMFGATTYADLGMDNPAPSRDPFEPIAKPAKGSLQFWWDELCQNGVTDNLLEVSSLPVTLDDGNEARDLITDEDLRRLRDFPELCSIHFFQEKRITDVGLAEVVSLPNLAHIHLYELPGCTGRFVRDLAGHSKLQVLSLSDLKNLKCEGLKTISKLTKLESILLSGAPDLTDAALAEIDLPSGLKHLRIVSSDVGDATLSRWLGQAELEYLDIDCQVSREIAPQLARQTRLCSLRIVNAEFLDEDFAFLAECEHLKRLRLCEMPIHGAFLSQIPHPKKLEHLDLTATLISDKQLPLLHRFSAINKLNLSWTPIQGIGFAEHREWPAIDEIVLTGTEFSEDGKGVLARLLGPKKILMPGNWTLGDDLRFPDRVSKYERQIKGDLTDFIEHSEYWTGGNLQITLTPESPGMVRMSNAPKDLMAPVLRLLELAKAKEGAE